MSKKCQSCSIPIKRDPKGGGTNADGSKSAEYCSMCFENGQFTQPDITVGEMQTLVKDKMKGMKFPGFLANMFTKGIPKLKRWNP